MKVADLSDLRLRGMHHLKWLGWYYTAVLTVAAIPYGSTAAIAAVLSGLLNIVPTYLARNDRIDPTARMIMALSVTAQPMLLIYAAQEGQMQIDMHLYFLISIALVLVLCDLRAIVCSCLLVVLHHAFASAFFPLFVFGTEGSFHRVMVHGVAVGVFGSITWTIAHSFTDLLSQLFEASRESEEQANLMGEQAHELEQALHRVELERQERERFQEEQRADRKREMRRIANDFESSVSSVTRSISQTASMLESTTKALNTIAHDAGRNASDVSISADAASNAARNVAQGVAELSHSIANIAANVSQQDDLTSTATQRSHFGGEAVGGLSDHSATIEEATHAIVRIAERTNLLSLNAAIEAASAGPAGRGFTIVAQEVKALAAQASEAATEIHEFLTGVRSGTIEAQRSFEAIDSAIAELAQAATSIRWDVEKQRKSADTIEQFARGTAEDIGAMAERSRSLADTASSTQELSSKLDRAAAEMLENVRNLEQSTSRFMRSLQAG